MRYSHVLSVVVTALVPGAVYSHEVPQQQILDLSHDRPNIVFILTDDQDTHLNSLQYMPYVKRHLIEKGTYFKKHYCTTAVCCPSRATLWTGKASHNTNITDVNPPYGGYPKFVEQGFNDNYLPVWLQQVGYNTYYTGKLFNAHTVLNYNSPEPAGFTGSEFLLDPFTYNYLNSTFQRKGEKPRSYEGNYSTDVVLEKAQRFLHDAVTAQKPFFLTIAPVAPHGNIVKNETATGDDPVLLHTAPVAAKRHEHLFEDVVVPRSYSFNPDRPSGANWLLDLPQQSPENIAYNDHFHRQRLRSLQAVDELVDTIISKLEGYGILHKTYIFYSSDNGFHIGQHRLQPGKSCGYEEDINIPLIVRGPGVGANHSTDIVTSHTDLAPTFFKLLGIPLRGDFDGNAIPVTRDGIESEVQRRREHVAVEYWGFAGGEGIYDTIRISGQDYNFYYSIWCNNEHELYDMDRDPAQMHNLLSASRETTEVEVAGYPLRKIVNRLDALLFVLKSCKGEVCRNPWKSLHPSSSSSNLNNNDDGQVLTLKDALAPEFDKFYENQQTRVRFNYCWNGYVPEAEGPMWEKDGLFFRDGLPWHAWV